MGNLFCCVNVKASVKTPKTSKMTQDMMDSLNDYLLMTETGLYTTQAPKTKSPKKSS